MKERFLSCELHLRASSLQCFRGKNCHYRCWCGKTLRFLFDAVEECSFGGMCFLYMQGTKRVSRFLWKKALALLHMKIVLWYESSMRRLRKKYDKYEPGYLQCQTMFCWCVLTSVRLVFANVLLIFCCSINLSWFTTRNLSKKKRNIESNFKNLAACCHHRKRAQIKSF